MYSRTASHPPRSRPRPPQRSTGRRRWRPCRRPRPWRPRRPPGRPASPQQRPEWGCPDGCRYIRPPRRRTGRRPAGRWRMRRWRSDRWGRTRSPPRFPCGRRGSDAWQNRTFSPCSYSRSSFLHRPLRRRSAGAKLTGNFRYQRDSDAAAGIERREGENLCIHRKTQVILNRKLLK